MNKLEQYFDIIDTIREKGIAYIEETFNNNGKLQLGIYINPTDLAYVYGNSERSYKVNDYVRIFNLPINHSYYGLTKILEILPEDNNCLVKVTIDINYDDSATLEITEHKFGHYKTFEDIRSEIVVDDYPLVIIENPEIELEVYAEQYVEGESIIPIISVQLIENIEEMGDRTIRTIAYSNIIRVLNLVKQHYEVDTNLIPTKGIVKTEMILGYSVSIVK